MIAHPFQLIPPAGFRWILRISLAVASLLFILLTLLGSPLRNDVAPFGIVSLELARTPPRAAQILESWQVRPPSPDPEPLRSTLQQGPAPAAEAAFQNLLLDFPFLLSYALALCLASLRQGGRAGIAFAWLIWLAALLDATENTLLLRMLGEGAHSPLPEQAFACASAKFALILATLLNLARKAVSG